MDTGRILRNCRKSRGLTIRDLADKAGVSYAHISNIENGLHDSRTMTFINLLWAMDYDICVVDLLEELGEDYL